MSITPAVHVRTLALADLGAAEVAEAEALLSVDERQRADRFTFPHSRTEYIAAHGLARRLLGDVLNADPARLEFATPEGGGKPFLVTPHHAGLDFSITHATGMVACAVSLGRRVGIDVEPIDRRVELALARRFFAPDEYEWLMALDEADRTPGFVRLWTLKEAVAKAVGLGLQMGFGTFSVRPDPPRLVSLPPVAGAVADWQVRQWQPGPGHLAALALV